MHCVVINELLKYAYQTSEELSKKEESKKTIESGGFVFNSNITESTCKHQNLISFVLRNRIMVENNSQFKSTNKSFLKIAIIRQVQQEKILFNQTELFSAIKYLTNKELKQLLIEFYKYDSQRKGKFEIETVKVVSSPIYISLCESVLVRVREGIVEIASINVE